LVLEPVPACYPQDIHWIGIESIYSYLKKEEQLGLNIDLRFGSAERLDAEDNSMDAVVGTLFCMCQIFLFAGSLTDS